MFRCGMLKLFCHEDALLSYNVKYQGPINIIVTFWGAWIKIYHSKGNMLFWNYLFRAICHNVPATHTLVTMDHVCLSVQGLNGKQIIQWEYVIAKCDRVGHRWSSGIVYIIAYPMMKTHEHQICVDQCEPKNSRASMSFLLCGFL